VTDCPGATYRFQVFLRKHLGDQPHALVEFEGFSIAVAGSDTRALLSAMLKGKESVVGQQGGILVTEDGEDAAFVFGTVGLRQGRSGLEVQQDDAVV